MCCRKEVGSYLRLINSCITQLQAQGPSRTCNKSKEVARGLSRPFAQGRAVAGVSLEWVQGDAETLIFYLRSQMEAFIFYL